MDLLETLDGPPPAQQVAESLIDGRYRLFEPIGRGGGGVVYRAHDVALDRTVAIKWTGFDDDGRAAIRACREARALARVRHENVVKVFAQGVHDEAYWIAMEHVSGRDVASIVTAEGPLPFYRALDIVRQIARGLEMVHEHGILHLDVKPSNVVIEDRTGRAVLVDFGLARPHVRTNESAIIGGTPMYMAPEQGRGADVDARSDVYALGCTAFELFAGEVPFVVTRPLQLYIAHQRTPPPHLSSRRPELDVLDGVLARAMAKAPEDRQQSAAQFLAELEEAVRCLRQSQVEAREPPPPPCLRIVVFAGESTRSTFTTNVRRALAATHDAAIIHCVGSVAAFIDAVAEPTDAVLIDDDVADGRADFLVETVRHAPNARDADVVVVGAPASSRRCVELGARELPSPVPPHVLRVLVSRVATRVVERRASGGPSLCLGS